MKWGILSKAAIATLTAYSISFSETLNLDIQNISEKLNYRYENGALVKNSPKITNFGQIENLTQEIYTKLTGKKKLPGIIILEKEKFDEFMDIGTNIEKGTAYSEFYSRTDDSVYVKEKNFGELMVVLSHGIGHSTTSDLSEGKGLEGKIAEEAKAIAFSRAWTEELSKNVFLENDASKGNVQFGKIEYDPKRTPLHYVADLLVEKIKKEKPTFQEVYKTIITKDLDQIIDYVRNNSIFIALKEKRISSGVYKGM